eukprot:scaffold656227_cov45-Prasinocladus_malaysianus.AAC.1
MAYYGVKRNAAIVGMQSSIDANRLLNKFPGGQIQWETCRPHSAAAFTSGCSRAPGGRTRGSLFFRILGNQRWRLRRSWMYPILCSSGGTEPTSRGECGRKLSINSQGMSLRKSNQTGKDQRSCSSNQRIDVSAE